MVNGLARDRTHKQMSYQCQDVQGSIPEGPQTQICILGREVESHKMIGIDQPTSAQMTGRKDGLPAGGIRATGCRPCRVGVKAVPRRCGLQLREFSVPHGGDGVSGTQGSEESPGRCKAGKYNK